MTDRMFADFEQAVVVLSGASSGLGSAIAMRLAECQARLLLLGRDQEKLNALLNSLPGSGHKSHCVELNDVAGLEASMKPVMKDFGYIYGLCHCAGVVQTRSLNMTRVDTIQNQYIVNVSAGIELARLVASRELHQQGGGSVVFISSIYSHVGAPGQTGYCASKGAINAAARAMALELAPRNIKVNTISPGFIRTEMTTNKSMLSQEQIQEIVDRHPLGEGQPEDIARAAVFLLAPQNRWITGSDFIIDGGYTAR